MISNYKIYVDMDGVLTDWEKQFERYSGGVPVDDYDNLYGKKKRYALVNINSPTYYSNMSWMNDGKTLYDFVKQFPNVEILSHAPDKKAYIGKLQWLRSNQVPFKANLVPDRKDKSKFANANSILIDDREDIVTDFINSGGKAILHKNTNDTINQLKNYTTMQESKHRIYNSVLNPDLWENNHLKSDVQEKLMKIAETFFDSTDLEVPLEDVLLLGSAAGYNWTPSSDVDVHLVIDFSKVNDDKELVQKYVDGLKSSWNDKHKIKLNNHPVEVYIQDKDHVTHSQAIYSIMNNEWVKKPKYEPPNVDKDIIKFKYKQFAKFIEEAISSGDIEKMKNLVAKLYEIRQAGLDKGGEYSVENIVFKLLRSTDYIKKLKDAINLHIDKDLSK